MGNTSSSTPSTEDTGSSSTTSTTSSFPTSNPSFYSSPDGASTDEGPSLDSLLQEYNTEEKANLPDTLKDTTIVFDPRFLLHPTQTNHERPARVFR